MAIKVTADVDHPAAHSIVTKEPTDLFPKFDVARVFLVDGLDTNVTPANQVVSASLMLDQAKLAPGVAQLGSLAPGAAGASGAVAIRQASLPIPQSDNSAYVVVSYENPLPGQPVAFVVSDDTALTTESTQLHPKDKSPMIMTYQAPVVGAAQALLRANGNGAIGVLGGALLGVTSDPAAKPEQYQANFRYSRPIRKVSITGYVVNANLDQYRNAIGSVNNAPWLRYGTGFWRFDDFHDDGILFGMIQKVTVGISSRLNENWMNWEVFNSPDLGRRVTVNPADVATLRNLGYFYGWQALNGIIVAGLYPCAGFQGLFGLGGGAAAPPQNGGNQAGAQIGQGLQNAFNSIIGAH